MPTTLSESDSKQFLAPYGIPFAPESIVDSAESAVTAAESIGYPVAAKLCGDNIAHKTERKLVRLSLATATEVADASAELLAAAKPEDRATGVLVAPMVSGTRELIAGISTDPQFGHTVLLGLGGVLAEAVEDVSVRLVPISDVDAREMIEELSSQALLGEFRGEPAVDRDALAGILTSLSAAALDGRDGERIESVDLNPLIISEGRPVAVDALVVLADPAELADPAGAGGAL